MFQRRQAGPDALDHAGEVVAPEIIGVEEDARAAIAEHLAYLGVAINADDRVDDEAAKRSSEVDDAGFDPVGRLKAHHFTGQEPEIAERDGERLRIGGE